MARTCDVEGCNRAHLARGWCAAHHAWWMRNGEAPTHELGTLQGSPGVYKYPLRVDDMSEAEVMYCVGLFEGEGCADRPASIGARLRVKMCDREPLDRFTSYADGSTERVQGPYAPRKRNWSTWFGIAYTGEQAVALAAILRPHLSPRRQRQIDEMLQEREAA